jgi:hypothetical protein
MESHEITITLADTGHGYCSQLDGARTLIYNCRAGYPLAKHSDYVWAIKRCLRDCIREAEAALKVYSEGDSIGEWEELIPLEHK